MIKLSVKSIKYFSLFIAILLTAQFVFAQKNQALSSYISIYRQKRDTSKMLERQVDQGEVYTNSEVFSSKKQYLLAMNNAMISYLKSLKSQAANISSSSFDNNNDYQSLEENIQTMTSYNDSIKDAQSTSDLKNIAKQMHNSWDQIRSENPNLVCNILKNSGVTLAEHMMSSLGKLKEKVPALRNKK